MEEHTSPYASDLVVIRDVLSGKDKKIKVSTLIGNKGVPEWDADTVWAADGSCTLLCDSRDIVEWQFRFWKSLIVNNEGNVPQEGANWEEVSEDDAQVSGNPDRLVKTCTKTAHGFIVKDVLTLNGSGILVKVTDPATQQRIGIVSDVIDADTFKLALAGYVSGLSGLVAGTKYYAQASGTIHTTATDMLVLIADTDTSGYILSSASIGTSGPAISEKYANIAALIADQADQEEDALYFVLDASTDTTVDIGWALYQKLTASTGVIANYRKLSEEESLDVIFSSPAWGSISGTLTDQTDLVTKFATKLNALPIYVPATGARTLNASDLALVSAGEQVEIQGNNTGALTIPLNSSVAFPIGTFITATGFTGSIIPTGGVTLSSTRGGVDYTFPSGTTITLYKSGTNTWSLDNGLPDASATTKGLVELATEAEAVTGTDTVRAATPAGVKAAVDAAILSAVEGLKWKDSVKVATTSSGTLASSFENGDTIDGVLLVTGNRILIKDQATQSENGIYIVAASGAPTRASDANSAPELEGATVPVQQGTSNANTSWTQTTDGITLGSSNIVWSQIGSSQPDASATVKGIVELATDAEAITGTDMLRAVTPANVKAVVDLIKNQFNIGGMGLS